MVLFPDSFNISFGDYSETAEITLIDNDYQRNNLVFFEMKDKIKKNKF